MHVNETYVLMKTESERLSVKLDVCMKTCMYVNENFVQVEVERPLNPSMFQDAVGNK